jgi:hypothetical protein
VYVSFSSILWEKILSFSVRERVFYIDISIERDREIER